MDGAAREVLQHFGLVPVALEALGNRGGFSGASLWRCETALGALCLRAWPAATTSHQLHFIHYLLRAAGEAGLPFVPRVLTAATGQSFVEHRQRLWDLTSWMPGKADFHEHPARVRLEAACEALARLHRAWAAVQPAQDVCPAIARRRETLRLWSTCAGSLGTLDTFSARAYHLIQRW